MSTLAARDTPADAKARKSARKQEKRDAAYLVWVRAQPCLVCGRYGCDPHHEPPRSTRGWHDHATVPLCRTHHTLRHALGYPRFTERTGIALRVAALEMRGRYLAQPEEPCF